MEYLAELFGNGILRAAVASWALAQFLKVVIAFIRLRRLDIGLMLSTGGMPSSHTAFMVAMTTAVGIREGFGTSAFAIAASITVVVMSDAAGVRRAAGKQAKVINTIVENIKNTGVVFDKKLKELLGHTPIEVACGAALGIAVAWVMYG